MSRPLLNPLALSTDTTSRFGLLVLAALLLTWNLGQLLVEARSPFAIVYDTSPELQQRLDTQIERFRQTGKLVYTEEDRAAALALEHEMRAKLSDVGDNLLRIGVSVLLVALFLGTTAGLYAALPAWSRRRFGHRPLSAAEAPRTVAEVAELARRMGVEPPELAVRPGLLGGLALRGRRGPCLVLDGAARWLDKSWSDLHRAVALHELGHIANGDIRTRELARCAWLELGLVVLAALPVAILCGSHDLPATSLRVGALALIVWWLWAGLVRARELYADGRVLEAGHGEALGRRLALPEPVRKRGLARLWDLHPSNVDRLAHLRAPEKLFRVSPGLALVTGSLAGMVAGHAGTAITDFIFSASLLVALSAGISGSGVLLVLGIVSIFAVLLAATITVSWTISASLGIQVLRSAVAGLAAEPASRWSYSSLMPFAGLFVLGLEGGLLLSPLAFGGWRVSSWMAAWALLVSAAVWIWLTQVHAAGRLVLGAVTDSPRRRFVERLLRAAAAVQLTLLMIPALVGRLALIVASDPSTAALLSRGDRPENEVVVILHTGAFVFSTFGIVLLVAVNLALLAALWLRLELRRAVCVACRQRAGLRAVGHRCTGCGRPVAGWLHLSPHSLPGDPA